MGIGGLIIAGIVNAKKIKLFLKSLLVKCKFYEWNNNRIKNKNDKKTQKILNEKITKGELIDIANTLHEISENTEHITNLTLLILIHIINEPNNSTLSRRLNNAGFSGKYDIGLMEQWMRELYQMNDNNRVITGKMVELNDNVKLLKKKIEELTSETN